MTTPHNDQQPGYAPGPYRTGGQQQGGQWPPQPDQAHAAPAAQGYGAPQGYGTPGYGAQPGNVQPYGPPPGNVPGYEAQPPGGMQAYAAPPGTAQGYAAPPANVPGYEAPPGGMQGYGPPPGAPAQGYAPQPGQGYPPPAEVTPGQVPPGQALPGQPPAGQAGQGYAPPAEVTPGQVPPGQVPPGQPPAGQVQPGLTAPEYGASGQTGPGQTGPGQTAPGQAPPEYGQPAYPYAEGYPASYQSGLPGTGEVLATAGKSIVKRIVVAVVGVVVLGAAGFVYNQLSGAPSTAKVGDCMAGQNENELKVVDCSDASARWTVTGKIENKTEDEFNRDREICAEYQDAGSAYWEGERGKAGYVLCLSPRK